MNDELPPSIDTLAPPQYLNHNINIISRLRESGVTKDNRNIRLTDHVKYEAELINNFFLLNELGKGSFGKVVKCRNILQNEYRAMKILSKSFLSKKIIYTSTSHSSQLSVSSALEMLINEIIILFKISISHFKNLICIYEVIEDYHSDKIYLIMDLATDGVLMKYDEVSRSYRPNSKDFNLFGGFPLSKLRGFFSQLIDAISYIHSLGIVHCDIKPDNIFLTHDKEENKEIIKLGDFGVSKSFLPNEVNCLISDIRGTLFFASPESISGLPYDGKIADVWSLGITFYALAYCKTPFESLSPDDLFDMIQHNSLNFPTIPPNSEPTQYILLNELIAQLLSKDPSKRIKLENITKHEFMNSDL